LIVNVFWVAAASYHRGEAVDGAWSVPVSFELLAPPVIWILAAGAAWLTSIHPVEITQEHLVLTGVSAVFAAALDAELDPPTASH
jgi:hypothetical protein